MEITLDAEFAPQAATRGKYHIWTIGCQMNTSDARKLSEELEEQGFRETEKARSADLVVLYSCMVRQHAEDKVRSKLGELRQSAPRQWVEVNASGAVAFRFDETGRDEVMYMSMSPGFVAAFPTRSSWLYM